MRFTAMNRSVRECLIILLLAGSATAQEKPRPVEESALRAAATKALHITEQSQRVFYERKQTCTSCHHQTLPILVQAAARQRGVAFDAEFAREVVTRSFSHLKDFDAVAQGYEHIDDIDEGWRLLAAHAAGIPANLSTTALAQYLASAQRPDGGWYTMDARPPQSYGRITITAVCAQAVGLYLPEQARDQKQAVLRQARAWLTRAQPRSTEERAYQLLGMLWTGADADVRKTAARQLLAQQRDDGGWSQLPHLPSDAYSTGEALYALHQAAGLATDAPAYQHGLRFLLKTQEADGSWRVESRLHPPAPVSPEYFNAGFPHGRRHQYISIMGTGWATLAMLQAVPPPGKKPAALMSPDLAPAEKDAWLPVALSGSAADLKKALDGGLNPNAKTARGTTALMLAARDPEKVKLLLTRGADVNARAESGFTALTMATQSHGNTAVVRLLLQRGARPNAAQDVPVKHGASPLFFAVINGDIETARVLLDAGAAIDAEMMVLGFIRKTPLMAAAYRGDTPMVEFLIGRGANPNWGDDAGMTPLDRAILSDHAETIKLLLARGAKVNHVDKLGMTPLLYAASVNYGDAAVTKLLLAAGADPKAQDPQGRTALELARAYRHGAVATVLGGKVTPP